MIRSFEARLEFVPRLTSTHIEQLWLMFQQEAWGGNRRLEDVGRAVEQSDLIFPYCDRETGRLVAFARVLTDYVYKAMIFDFVVEQGDLSPRLTRFLLDAITAHPALLFVEHIELSCRDEMVPFYEKFGFKTELRSKRSMRKIQAPLLSKPALATKAS